MGKNDEVLDAGEEIYQELKGAGIDTLLDDRKERAGIKFNDADLIGCPIRITLGSRSLKEGKLEVKLRQTGEELEIPLEDYLSSIKEIIEGLN